MVKCKIIELIGDSNEERSLFDFLEIPRIGETIRLFHDHSYIIKDVKHVFYVKELVYSSREWAVEVFVEKI